MDKNKIGHKVVNNIVFELYENTFAHDLKCYYSLNSPCITVWMKCTKEQFEDDELLIDSFKESLSNAINAT